MATSKLERYNEALGHLEARKLASLSENREPRRVLDDYWDGTVALALQRGFWNHAIRSMLIDSAPSIDPEFGYTHAFTKPADWVKTYELSANETFNPPLVDREIVDENGLWYSDVDPLYVKYVSSDPAYGMDLSLWGPAFADYVSLALAVKACNRITGSVEKLEGAPGLLSREKKALALARSIDAMDEPVRFPQQGSWVRSRGAGSFARSRWDRRS